MTILSAIARTFGERSLGVLYWLLQKGSAPFMALILLFYNPEDPTPNTATGAELTHPLGTLGALVADSWLQLMGGVAYICMGIWLVWSAQSFLKGKPYNLGMRWLSWFVTIMGCCWLFALSAPYGGGLWGELLVRLVNPQNWLWRLALSCITALAALHTLSVRKDHALLAWRHAREACLWTTRATLQALTWLARHIRRTWASMLGQYTRATFKNHPALSPKIKQASEPVQNTSINKPASQKAPSLSPTEVPLKLTPTRSSSAGPPAFTTCAGDADYNPSFDLLDDYAAGATPPSEDQLREQMQTLMRVLKDFGIEGKIQKACPGPVVTLYELELAPGIKSSRVISLADDIARSMSALATRVSVIPGRNIIGIELPNETRETVFLKDILARKAFAHTKSTLPLALGKNIAGTPVIVDLARMPHLLVAGTTGSGKSVGINTMILSLLFRLPPKECQLLMIDPKMLELSVYNGIPHLIAPVIVDPKKAVQALKWAVFEMERRYKLMSAVGVRNIDGYNRKINAASSAGQTLTRTVQTGFDNDGQPIFEDEALSQTPLPYIVIIVDEMADLMLVAGKDIEGAIQRLAQMARAAGLHLIMATQRPSVDVLTGTIKANFPTRLSFQVTSKIDSRTILGEQGAEQLLGRGDMLYMPPGDRMLRVHGPFVSDAEVERVVSFLKQTYPRPSSPVSFDLTDTGLTSADSGDAADDGLFEEAVSIVVRDQKASTSYLQRRLQIGYNRAARLIEDMEARGIVSSSNHAGKRTILKKDGSP